MIYIYSLAQACGNPITFICVHIFCQYILIYRCHISLIGLIFTFQLALAGRYQFNIQDIVLTGSLNSLVSISRSPYPEPVYTGWSSVHWNATGMPLVDPVYTGIPLEKLSWNSPTLECHWRNLVESAPHWDATGETLTFAAYAGTPLEGLWQPTHAPTHIVRYVE